MEGRSVGDLVRKIFMRRLAGREQIRDAGDRKDRS